MSRESQSRAKLGGTISTDRTLRPVFPDFTCIYCGHDWDDHVYQSVSVGILRPGRKKRETHIVRTGCARCAEELGTAQVECFSVPERIKERFGIA